MPSTSMDAINSVRISLQVDAEPHLLIILTAEGLVKRMGYGSLSMYEQVVATGHVDGLFSEFMASVPSGLMARAGVYQDPGTDGEHCHWRIDFDREAGPLRFELTYCSRSAGLPGAIAELVQKAEALTEPWYRERLAVAHASAREDDVTSAPTVEPAMAVAGGKPTSPAWSVTGIGEYLSFRGRIGRADYFMQYVLPLAGLTFAGGFADGLVGLASADQIGPMGAASVVITLWPGMAGWAKRLHDLDTSLWIVPGMVVGGAAFVGVGMAVSGWLGVAAVAIWGLALMFLIGASYVWPGTKGPNRYGPPRASTI